MSSTLEQLSATVRERGGLPAEALGEHARGAATPHGEVAASTQLWGAVKTILIADLIMSTDNVIAVAAAAKGSILLLVLGLVISIPLVIFGATLLMVLMERYPIIITLGAAVLGWTAGEMGVTDPAVADWVKANSRDRFALRENYVGDLAIDTREPVSISR